MAAELPGYKGWGVPIRMSRTPGEIRRTPPRFGEHGRAILAEIGLGEDEIASLIEAGVVLERRQR
jgi:formyl-CoA transferase